MYQRYYYLFALFYTNKLFLLQSEINLTLLRAEYYAKL